MNITPAHREIARTVGIAYLILRHSLADVLRFIKRRYHMGPVGWLELAEQLEKIVSDAKAAEQTPAGQKLIADVEAFIAQVKANAPAAA